MIKSQQRFRSDHHREEEEVNKMALSSNDYKRIETFDKVTMGLILLKYVKTKCCYWENTL